MACIEPDGSLSRCGEHLLLAMWTPATPEEVAVACRAPLFRVRSAIREFVQARLIEEDIGGFVINPEGMKKMEG